MEASIGVNLRVTAHSSQGGRKYMEDMFCVAYQPTADEKDLLYAYFGIFDGHGGREAALYAKQHLMDHIVSQKNFWSDDDELVLKAIRDGFITTHYAMWKDLENWPRTPSGLPSTSGTTATIGFVRRGKMYIGHVGDSAIVLGYQDPVCGYWRAKPLTKDHKPESMTENARITQCGGKVVSKSGVPRVVWNRPRVGHKGPVRRSTTIDEIPFLAVARSLGDLWSYNSAQNQFVVSPEPDVSVIEIDVNSHRCFVFGSDGLWNMLNSQDAVNSVYFAEKNNERQLLASPPDTASTQVKNWINPSKRLVDRALDRWYHHNLRADNTSVVTVVIDPPGPPKAQVLRQTQSRSYVIRHSNSGSRNQNSSSPASSVTVASPSKVVGLSKPAIPSDSGALASGHPQTGPRTPGKVDAKHSTRRGSALPTKRLQRVSNVQAQVARSRGGKRALSKSTIVSATPVDDLSALSSSVNVTSRTSGRNNKHQQSQEGKKRLNKGKADDIQIHEITSSSEPGRSRSLESPHSSKRIKLTEREKTRTRVGKSASTKIKLASNEHDLVLPVSVPDTKTIQRSSRRNSRRFSLEDQLSKTLVHETSHRRMARAVPNTKAKKATEKKSAPICKSDKSLIMNRSTRRSEKQKAEEMVSTKNRSLRSTSMASIRCTRSMTKHQ